MLIEDLDYVLQKLGGLCHVVMVTPDFTGGRRARVSDRQLTDGTLGITKLDRKAGIFEGEFDLSLAKADDPLVGELRSQRRRSLVR
jgi:hypothetical protein